MTRKQRSVIDAIALIVIVGGFAIYYIPSNDDILVGWERLIPVGLAAVYWACRETLFRWLGRRL